MSAITSTPRVVRLTEPAPSDRHTTAALVSRVTGYASPDAVAYVEAVEAQVSAWLSVNAPATITGEPADIALREGALCDVRAHVPDPDRLDFRQAYVLRTFVVGRLVWARRTDQGTALATPLAA